MAIRLLIVGGGAAGLMAAATAAERGIPAMLLERRHRLGLKLLLCGNNRCNISHDFTVPQMLRAYGEPVADFLRPALEAFPPAQLRRWFLGLNLKTVVKHDNRIYLASENADDVLHAFTDYLRDRKFPYALNCPVKAIRRGEAGFSVETETGLVFEAENLLVATGGASYPKTGSVGDGVSFAAQLGLKTTPLRAGLVAVETSLPWLAMCRDTDVPDVRMRVLDASGTERAGIRGNLLCNPGILRGSAVFDATRFCARQNLSDFRLVLDLFPKGELSLNRLPRELASALKAAKLPNLHEIPVPVTAVRPLKEAIVTVGGVACEEIDPETMQAHKVPGLYFAGETLDVDGPTGGFNLHAAFATARLAVTAVAEKTDAAGRNRRNQPTWKESHPVGKRYPATDWNYGRKGWNRQSGRNR